MLICINPPDISEKESDSKHYENWSKDKCNDILISQPKNKYAYFRLGCLNLSTNPIKARACLKECQEIDPKFRPGDCVELIADSIINDEKNENSDALPFYEQAGKTSPEKISALVKLHRLSAFQLANDEKITEAIEELEKARKLDPKNIYILNRLGEMYMSIETPDFNIAKELISKSIKLCPSSSESYISLGRIYRK